jgi:hypothetical protein
MAAEGCPANLLALMTFFLSLTAAVTLSSTLSSKVSL